MGSSVKGKQEELSAVWGSVEIKFKPHTQLVLLSRHLPNSPDREGEYHQKEALGIHTSLSVENTVWLYSKIGRLDRNRLSLTKTPIQGQLSSDLDCSKVPCIQSTYLPEEKMNPLLCNLTESSSGVPVSFIYNVLHSI